MDNIPFITDYILTSTHPYYIRNLCTTNNVYKQFCYDDRYYILKKWSNLDYSTEELRFLLPYATFFDIVELCLLYYPIPESINYYDGITLFWYACQRKLGYAIDFFVKWIELSYNSVQIHATIQDAVSTICLICYKYTFADPLKVLLGLNKPYIIHHESKIRFIMNCILKKLDPDFDVRSNLNSSIVTNYVDVMINMPLFSPEEVVEFTIICNSIEPLDTSGMNALTGNQDPKADEYSIAIALNKNSDLEILQTYADKYHLNMKFKRSSITAKFNLLPYLSIIFSNVYQIPDRGIYSFSLLYKIRNQIIPHLEITDRMVAYATNANFLSYIDLRSRGNRIQYLQTPICNELGIYSLNRDMFKFFPNHYEMYAYQKTKVGYDPILYPSKEEELIQQINQLPISGFSIGVKLQLIEMILAMYTIKEDL